MYAYGVRCNDLIHCKMFTTIRSVNTFLTCYNYHFVLVMVRMSKIHFHSNSQVYNVVLVTMVTLWYPRSPKLTHLEIGNWSLLTNISLFLTPPLQPTGVPVLLSATMSLVSQIPYII